MQGRWLIVLLALAVSQPTEGNELVDSYLQTYFEMFPSAATAAGRHDRDAELEDLAPVRREQWLLFNRQSAEAIRRELGRQEVSLPDRLDLELLLREAERQIFAYGTLRSAESDPLYWTSILANATVFLLVRDDLPRQERLASAASRAELLPRLAGQARDALATADPSRISADLCKLAARQARSTGRFYEQGFARAAEGLQQELQLRLSEAGASAAAAANELADFLEELAGVATGSPRLAGLYDEKFRLVTGVERPVEEILVEAEEALQTKVRETAKTSREFWSVYFPDQPAPIDDRTVIAAMFSRVSLDRAESTEEFIEDYRQLVAESVEFVRNRRLMTLPEPLTLQVDRSPAYFIGQSVGGVYPAGPYAPNDAKTLLFLPTPSDQATAEERDAFFRDFNHHFNVMITPHELIPGHYLQLKFAARHPRKVRALFGDGVYIEGWGTFAERLMLDLGWGGPLDRIAHLKKQLENIARTIVDIRFHTQGMSREEVLTFVRDEALQEQQFAANMWRRAMTSSPQLTFYFLGYTEVWGLYDEIRAEQGEDFDLRRFMDGMMELGPVPIQYYRDRMLSQDEEAARSTRGS